MEDDVVIVDDSDYACGESNLLVLEHFHKSNMLHFQLAVREAREKYRDREDNLAFMMSLSPEIPIVHSKEKFLKWNWNGYNIPGHNLLPHGDETFFLTTGFRIQKYLSKNPCNKVECVGNPTKIKDRIEYTFFGKIVFEGEFLYSASADSLNCFSGQSSNVKKYVETDTHICFIFDLELPADFEKNLYRNLQGGIEIGEDVIHFASTPWSFNAYEGEYYSNVLFRNLHTSELRRYILEGYTKNSKFFMLHDEIYFTRRSDDPRYDEIVHCSSNTVVCSKKWKIDAVTTCRDYVVFQMSGYMNPINVLCSSAN